LRARRTPRFPRIRSSPARLLVAALLVGVCGGAATPPPVVRTSSPTATLTPNAAATPTPSATSTQSATASATIAPSAAPTVAPPAPTGGVARCAVADILTARRGYDEYARTILDTTYRLDASYVPPDLVATSVAPYATHQVGGDQESETLRGDDPDALVRAIVVPDLAAMRAEAAAAGARLVIQSAYRSYEEQRATFDYWVSVGGYEAALATSARAGHSEHQLGTAIDFSDGRGAPSDHPDWATTPSGAWLASHGWEYGFVMSYPPGKRAVTCYAYEPWHYRWVGRETASRVRASGLTLREYLERAR
jgi:D-alanyl-D-alanine carboxypeptidase